MFDVVVEAGSKKLFASALEWPGWSRSGRTEDAALEALLAYAPRYAAALRGAVPGFTRPESVASLRVIERVRGNATTDFGVPVIVAEADRRAVDADDLERLKTVLVACWAAFDAAAEAAAGVDLRKGPRGGGRDLDKMRAHVLEGEWSYLKAAGGTPPNIPNVSRAAMQQMHGSFLETLERRMGGAIGTHGPRGRIYWPLRYAVRRAAWHVLDHAWEIEDRAH